MKILVTGATGFIGKNTFIKLKEKNYEVFGTSLNGGSIGKSKITSVDLRDRGKTRKFMKNKKFDVVIHLASAIPKNITNALNETYLFDNISQTLNLLEEIKNKKKCRFIYVSSMSIMGKPKYLPVDEKHPFNIENYYSSGKLCCEILCKQQMLQNKLQLCIIRISSPYGPGQNPTSVIPLFINMALKSMNINIYGSGKRSQDFIYIKDIVNLLVSIIKKKSSGVYNIGSGESTSTIDLANIILNNTNQTKSKIIFNGKMDEQEGYKMKVDIKKARKELNFRPKFNIKKGIKDYINNISRGEAKSVYKTKNKLT